MYAGVLGEKPQKTYYGLYQHRRQASPGKHQPSSGAASARHQGGGGFAGASEHGDHDDDLDDDSTSASTDPYASSALDSRAAGTHRSAAPRRSTAAAAAWGAGAWPAMDASVHSSVYTSGTTAAQRNVPQLGMSHGQPSVPLLGDPRRTPRAATFGGSTLPGAAPAQPYGAPPKDLVTLQQYGLDGRSVFPDGYLHYLNKISYDPPIPSAASSVAGETRRPGPPPEDHFAGQRHRLVSEQADKFDTSNANWIHALRSAPSAPLENVRNNNGNDPPSPRRRKARDAARGGPAGARGSPPYASRRSTTRTASSYMGRSGGRGGGGGGVGAARQVPPGQVSREKASHKRWVPTESRSLNGWIMGLRDDGAPAPSTRRWPQQGGRGQQPHARQRLWRTEGGGGHQRQSWLRSVHRNSHLLRHTTHSSRIDDLGAGVVEAAAAARRGVGGGGDDDDAGMDNTDANARVLECPFDCGHRSAMTALELRQHLTDKHFTNDPHQLKKHEDIAKTMYFTKQQNFLVQQSMALDHDLDPPVY